MQSNSQLSQFRNRFAKNLEIVQCRPAVFEAPQLNTSLLALTHPLPLRRRRRHHHHIQEKAGFVYGSDLLMFHAGLDSPINLLLKRDGPPSKPLVSRSSS